MTSQEAHDQNRKGTSQYFLHSAITAAAVQVLTRDQGKRSWAGLLMPGLPWAAEPVRSALKPFQ
jgi:hypothetical protein